MRFLQTLVNSHSKCLVYLQFVSRETCLDVRLFSKPHSLLKGHHKYNKTSPWSVTTSDSTIATFYRYSQDISHLWSIRPPLEPYFMIDSVKEQ